MCCGLTGTDPERITVIPEGSHPCSGPHPPSGAQLRARGSDRPFLLAVGTFDPRKRVALLADVVRRVRDDHDVAARDRRRPGNLRGDVMATLARAGIAESSRVIGHVTTEDL